MKSEIKIIIIFILLLVIGIAGYKIVEYNSILKESTPQEKMNEAQTSVSEAEVDSDTITERMLEVQELQKQNADVKGWLEIEGTNISYPVMQDDNNEYYMTHNYKKEYTKDGSLFLDKDYDWNLPSSNLLIYGHNNKNNKMFANLLSYQEEAFYEEHPTIKFTTEKEEAEYEIIAAFLSRVYYKSETGVFRYYFFINAENEKEFTDYVSNSKKASIYETGKIAEYGDQLLTLSTCSYHTEDGRFAVVARKVK